MNLNDKIEKNKALNTSHTIKHSHLFNLKILIRKNHRLHKIKEKKQKGG